MFADGWLPSATRSPGRAVSYRVESRSRYPDGSRGLAVECVAQPTAKPHPPTEIVYDTRRCTVWLDVHRVWSAQCSRSACGAERIRDAGYMTGETAPRHW